MPRSLIISDSGLEYSGRGRSGPSDPTFSSPHSITKRVNEVSSWMREAAKENGLSEDPVQQVRKRMSVPSLEKVKERVDEKREEGDWSDEVAYIDTIEPLGEHFPFSTTGQVVYPDETGLWLVTMSSGRQVLRSVSPLNIGGEGNLTLLDVRSGAQEALDELEKAIDGIEVGPELEPGIYEAHTTMGSLFLDDDVDIQETPVIHPAAEEFFESVEGFFENPEPYTRFDQPGMKTWLLYGTYGTGKSTMVSQLARKMEEEVAVVLTADANELQAVANIAADQSAPTIIIVSEAEVVLNDSQGQAPSEDAGTVGASSEMLNFLDGIGQPRNEAGLAVVMSTNRPGRISNRILKRSGRINKRVRVGPLTGDYAVECGRFYLPESADVSEEVLLETVDGRVGDDIKSVAERAIHVAIEEEKQIDDEIFKQAVEEMEEDMREIEEFGGMEDESHEFAEGEDVGFGA